MARSVRTARASGTGPPGRAARLLAPLLATLLLAGCFVGSGDTSGNPSAPSVTTGARQVRLTVVESDGRVLALVPVTIDGQGPFRFVLDTGAASSVVAADVAQSLDLPRTGERRLITGVVGTEKVPVVTIDDWKIGKVALDPTDAAVVTLRNSGSDPTIQGLLGSDVLSRFGQISLDYDHEVLRLPSG
ncbi:clan AA aspartic protease [Streptomyces sp. MUM 136J]|uniref:retropepsin-like aspartic protease n=1 Tax=Streptomyces sp. MUM 136J TaxID=2791992 RepID=UPI001F04427E|nr:retropepsin-like aspartic protease [Streptomyces sp. MUM 136J]MCH0572219.1 clan AA aspartic protease [Streptomyces sp. MUM 136J]